MTVIAEGGCHVDDSFDEFSFFEVGHGSIAALKLGAAEAIATFQGRKLKESFGGHGGKDAKGLWLDSILAGRFQRGAGGGLYRCR